MSARTAAIEHRSIPRAALGFWWAVLVFIVLRPISAPETWWELSRGRTVWRGSWTPSDTLLAVADRPETNWLGGLPMWLSYSLLSGSGLMLMKLGLLATIGVVITRIAGVGVPWFVRAGLVTLAVGVCSTAADASPLYWDLVGVLMIVCVRRFSPHRESWTEFSGGLLAMLVWANSGPRFLLAIVIGLMDSWILAKPIAHESSPWLRRASRLYPLALLLVGCATPRGAIGIWDSARVLVPRLAAPHSNLAATPFASVLQVDWGLAEFSCAMIVLLLVARSSRVTEARRCAGCAVVIGVSLVILSAQNLAIIGLWLSLLAATREATRSTIETAVPAKLASNSNWLCGSHPALAVIGFTIGLGSGWLVFAIPGMGWGLDAALDERLLRNAIQTIDFGGVAWTADVRSAGMWCWVVDKPSAIHDFAPRALLHDRWEAMRQIDDDLRHARLTRYYRSDGSEGGWWLELEQRRVRALVVPASDVDLVAALASTIWQPLSLDSPTIPYGRAGDAACAPLLLQTVMERELVERGNWQFSLAESTASEYDRDRFGFTPLADRENTALRQARLFHALGLHFAALRVLSPLRSASMSREVAQHLAAVHRDQLHHEQIESGETTGFRRAVLTTLRTEWSLQNADTLLRERTDSDIVDVLRDAAKHYCHGDTAATKRLLTDLAGDQARLALALLWHEQGDSEVAKRELTKLRSSGKELPIRKLAGFWLRKLEATLFSDAMSVPLNKAQR